MTTDRIGESAQANLTSNSAGLMGATRAWWTLTSWGFTDVRVLDGAMSGQFPAILGQFPGVSAIVGGFPVISRSFWADFR